MTRPARFPFPRRWWWRLAVFGRRGRMLGQSLPLLVGLCALIVTALLWRHEEASRRELLQSAFDASLRQLSGRIDQRLASYEQMLRGAQGLVEASGPPTQEAFDRYMDALLAGANHTGLKALAYHPAPGLPPSEAGQRLCAPGLPSDPGHFPGNPWTNPALQPAMLQARNAGQMALSGRVQLTPLPGQPPGIGFLMFLPVYRPEAAVQGGMPGTAADRPARLIGWVWATLSVSDMMSSLYGERVPGLSLRLYEGVQARPEALMFTSTAVDDDDDETFTAPAAAARASHHEAASLAVSAPVAVPVREAQEFLALAGRSWMLVVRAEADFEARLGPPLARPIAVGGLVLSLLLALLTAQLQRGRAQAVGLARFAAGELRESEARYRRIVETTSEGICMLDAEARASFVNPRLAEMLGWPVRLLLGQTLDAFLAPDSPPLPAWPITEPQHTELCLRHADGTPLWAAVAFTPMPDTLGLPGPALAMVRDISARKQAERRQALLQAQLRESQKLEAIGTLAGGIAHDFNNILAAILGNVALARQQVAQGAAHPGSGGLHDTLDRIDESGSRARSLVQQILAFSRQQAPALVTQPLQPLVEETGRLLRATLPAGVQLVLTQAETPLPVHADATQVQQVLMNLCTNAWHAMGGRGGRIEIGLSPLHLQAPLPERLSTLAPGDYAMLWVADDGAGMSPETLSRLFEPFFTTKPVGEGTGLGLAVVHGIVATHRGVITVDSQPGRGSRFTLYLPLDAHAGTAAAPPAVPAPAPATFVPLTPLAALPPAAPGTSPAGRGEHLLVVDDDPAIGLIVERLLLNAGYRVSLFEQPEQALSALQADATQYDLVLSDFNMPGLSGLDVARACAALRPTLPVVISSGYLSDDVRQEARAAGVCALLQKEFSVEQLPALVRQVLDTH